MADRINEKSGGRLKAVPYYAETLLKQAESFRGTQLGVADMAYFGPAIAGSPLNLAKINGVPFLGITSAEMARWVYSRILEACPELKSEFRGVKVLGVSALPGGNLHFTKKSVHTPSNMKGIKTISFGGPVAHYLKEVGATPLGIGVGDWYTSLERGLADGLSFVTPALAVLKLEDLFRYHTVINMSSGTIMWLFNEQKWNSLPVDLQKVVEEAAEWRATETMKLDRLQEETVLASIKKKGHEVYYPTADEMKLWVAAARPVQEKWIADMEAKGLAGKKVFDQYQAAIRDYKRATSK
jgi:TRAP-type C4-dicarboxylate transport system substrate-binding protein